LHYAQGLIKLFVENLPVSLCVLPGNEMCAVCRTRIRKNAAYSDLCNFAALPRVEWPL